MAVGCAMANQKRRVEAVTRGVRVRASVVFAPEHCNLRMNRFVFSYSISFELLAPEEQRRCWVPTAGPFRPLESVQLLARHWLIRGADGELQDEVHGEAVIGQYPLLRAGGEPFEYQSCTQQREPHGSMEGDFTFVEGCISRPAGPEFIVACPRFELCIPEYIF